MIRLKNSHSIDIQQKSLTDEYYTPDSAILPILPFIPKNWTVWCPFDEEWSSYVKLFRKNGNPVIFGSILSGKDFFSYTPDRFDCIVSNPPFSRRDEIFERLVSFNKPFAVIMNSTGIFGSKKRFSLFSSFDVQVFILKDRIKYYTTKEFHENERERPMFQSWYICRDILPKQITFEGE